MVLAREITIQGCRGGGGGAWGGVRVRSGDALPAIVERFSPLGSRREENDEKLRESLGDTATNREARSRDRNATRLFPERQELVPHEERLLFFDAVVQLFSTIAQRQSLLFYADDLHWADGGTLWLLGHLLRLYVTNAYSSSVRIEKLSSTALTCSPSRS